jgi:hypothetical protein
LPLDFLLEFEREAKARKAHGKTAPGRWNTCGMHARHKRHAGTGTVAKTGASPRRVQADSTRGILAE